MRCAEEVTFGGSGSTGRMSCEVIRGRWRRRARAGGRGRHGDLAGQAVADRGRARHAGDAAHRSPGACACEVPPILIGRDETATCSLPSTSRLGAAGARVRPARQLSRHHRTGASRPARGHGLCRSAPGDDPALPARCRDRGHREGDLWLAREPPPLRPLRRAKPDDPPGGLAAHLRCLRRAAFPAHRPGGDHAGDAWQCRADGALARLARRDVFAARRLHRAGRDGRGGGAPRGLGRGGRARGARGVSRQPAVAVSRVADAGLSRRGAEPRDRHRPIRDRGCPLDEPRGGARHLCR